MSGSSSRDDRKRPPSFGTFNGSDTEDQGIELMQLRDLSGKQQSELTALHTPINSRAVQGVYDMQKPGDRQRLASAVWSANFKDCMGHLRAANPEFMAVLADQTANQTTQTVVSVLHKERQLDGILLNTVRAQSIHKVPMLTVALSIMCEANLVKREFHDSISFLMKGALMSETWVEKFMKEASLARPLPTEPMIPRVMVTVFDNLTMNVAYHSFSVGGVTGEQLDMTNWFAVNIPKWLAPTLDGMNACTLHVPRTRRPAYSPTALPSCLLCLTQHMPLAQFAKGFSAAASPSTVSAGCSILTIHRLSRTKRAGGSRS